MISPRAAASHRPEMPARPGSSASPATPKSDEAATTSPESAQSVPAQKTESEKERKEREEKEAETAARGSAPKWVYAQRRRINTLRRGTLHPPGSARNRIRFLGLNVERVHFKIGATTQVVFERCYLKECLVTGCISNFESIATTVTEPDSMHGLRVAECFGSKENPLVFDEAEFGNVHAHFFNDTHAVIGRNCRLKGTVTFEDCENVRAETLRSDPLPHAYDAYTEDAPLPFYVHAYGILDSDRLRIYGALSVDRDTLPPPSEEENVIKASLGMRSSGRMEARLRALADTTKERTRRLSRSFSEAWARRSEQPTTTVVVRAPEADEEEEEENPPPPPPPGLPPMGIRPLGPPPVPPRSRER